MLQKLYAEEHDEDSDYDKNALIPDTEINDS